MIDLFGRECWWEQNATLKMSLLTRLLPLGPLRRTSFTTQPLAELGPPGTLPALQPNPPW